MALAPGHVCRNRYVCIAAVGAACAVFLALFCGDYRFWGLNDPRSWDSGWRLFYLVSLCLLVVYEAALLGDIRDDRRNDAREDQYNRERKNGPG